MVDVEEKRAQGIAALHDATAFLVVTLAPDGGVHVRGSDDLVATGGILAYLNAWQEARMWACFKDAEGKAGPDG